MTFPFRSPSLAVALCCLMVVVAACHAQQPAASADTASAATTNAIAPDIDRAALTDYLRYVNLWPQEVQIEIGNPVPSPLLPGFFDLAIKISAGQAQLTQKYLLSPDGQHLVRAQSGDRLGKTVFNTASYPFDAEQQQLKLDGRPSVGPADAPVTVAVYSDFQCGFCREEAKILRSNLLSAFPDKVRLVFVDFPLAQIHDWTMAASVAGRCVSAQEPARFWAYHDWIFDEQPAVTASNFSTKLAEWAGRTGLDTLQLNRCLADETVKASVTKSFQDALDMGLTSTPTLFINGRQIGGRLEWAGLKQVIDAELDYQAKLAKKKEECCTVTLPGIFNQ